MSDCMIIRGVDKDDYKKEVRPKSAWPGNHWTTRLIDIYKGQASFSVKFIEDEWVVTITKQSKDEDPELFERIMKFAEENNLDHTECRRECEACAGHDICLTPHK